MGDIIIQVVEFAILSSIYIVPGLSILTAKRPFIVSQRRLVILGFAPSMAIMIRLTWPKYPGESLLPSFLLIGFMTIGWGVILSQGYRVVGATRMVLNDALRQALRRLNLPYEESAQVYRLPTLNNELLAEATPIDWMFNLRFKRFGDRSTFRQLAAEINEFFRNAPVRTNRRAGYALVVIGAAFLLFGSWLTYDKLSTDAEWQAWRKAHSESFRPSER